MTWALIAARFVLSIPIGCLAVRLLIPAAPGAVGAFVMSTNSSARRTAPNANATPARVFSNPRMVAGDKP
jgi:hypothetical protein